MSRRFWTSEEVDLLRELYPHRPTAGVAEQLGRSLTTVYQKAIGMGLRKSAEYLASPASGRTNGRQGMGTRFGKGHVPANKGLRRPGWGPGRMRETQFKKGHTRNVKFELGTLRLNADGYVDMKVTEAPGAKAWRAFHVVLWEDEYGPVPKGHALVFKDKDRLNIDLPNIELVSRADLCRRNSIHNLPPDLKHTIVVLGQLKRRIREKQDRASARPSL